MTKKPDATQTNVASADHHKVLTDAGYEHTETVASTTADQTRTTSRYHKPAKKGKGEGGGMMMSGDSVTVTKDSQSGEATWERNQSGDGDWKTQSGSSADGLSKALECSK